MSDERDDPQGHHSAPSLETLLRALRPILGDGVITAVAAAVALEREQADPRLPAAWCQVERARLWIDGDIAGKLAIDERAPTFGVVKSHNTRYGDEQSVRDVLALRAGQRSPVFRVGHRPRRAVARWSLRVRGDGNGDPLHGLVRGEVAPPASNSTAVSLPLEVCAPAGFPTHVDQLSLWMLAEGTPRSLPRP